MKRILLALGITFSFAACAAVSPFSPVAYEQATSMKVDAIKLIGEATEPFNKHAGEVELMKSRMEKAYEYAKGRTGNEFSTKQWEIMRSTTANQLGGFFERWKKKSTLKMGAVADAQDLIGRGFDQIIGLESGKIKPREAQ